MTVGLLSIVSQPTTIFAGAGAIPVAGGAVSFSQSSPSGTLSAAAGAIPVTGGAATITSGGSLLTFHYIFDANWTSSAPQTYKDALVTATNIMTAAFPNTNCTLNIEVGYTYYGQNENGTTTVVGANSALGGDAGSPFISYSTIRAAMAAIPSPTASLTALLNNTPAGSSLNGQSGFNVSRSGCKVLKLFGFAGGPTSATDVGLDGVVCLGTGWTAAELVGVFLHEIGHAIGREQQIAPMVFSRFTSAGVRDFAVGTANTYFSLDGGTTHLADYDTTSDPADFKNGGVQDGNTGASWASFASDCYDAFQSANSVETQSTVDLQYMNSTGFQ
jgi:hypothetical protein